MALIKGKPIRILKNHYSKKYTIAFLLLRRQDSVMPNGTNSVPGIQHYNVCYFLLRNKKCFQFRQSCPPLSFGLEGKEVEEQGK